MILVRSWLAASIAIFAFAAGSPAFGQGSLTPAGTPAPTMKTLDQVEARIPLPAVSGTSITTDGSYYLTGSIAAGGFFAIAISANNVTLDLNGYTITATSGTGTATPAVFYTGTGHLTVRNGHIHGNTTYDAAAKTFTNLGFGYGVYVQNAAVVCIENVEVTGVTTSGILVSSTAATAEISHCQVNVSAGKGITVANKASSIDHCVALNCGTDAIAGGQVTDCYAVTTGSATALSAETALNCYGSSGTGDGISANATTNCHGISGGSGNGVRGQKTAVGCWGESSGGNGISAENASECSGTSTSGFGIAGNTMSNCVGVSTSARGISGSQAENCNGTSSTDVGLFAANNATNSRGFSTSGTGLQTAVATGCLGSTGGSTTTAVGIEAGAVATGCRATAPTSGSAIALRVPLANGCSVSGTTAITNKYNMP